MTLVLHVLYYLTNYRSSYENTLCIMITGYTPLVMLYLHRHEADQYDYHLGQLEEVELLLLHTALPLLLTPEVITSVNNGNISTCLMFCRSITASPKQ